jgi:hypothetical protein
MNARRTCPAWGDPIQAKRSTRRFCSERCKKRAQRAAQAGAGEACPAK